MKSSASKPCKSSEPPRGTTAAKAPPLRVAAVLLYRDAPPTGATGRGPPSDCNPDSPFKIHSPPVKTRPVSHVPSRRMVALVLGNALSVRAPNDAD